MHIFSGGTGCGEKSKVVEHLPYQFAADSASWPTLRFEIRRLHLATNAFRGRRVLADDDQFFFALRREYPEYADRLNDGATRRQFLRLMGASLALAAASGCIEQPQEKIVPFVPKRPVAPV